MRTEHRFQVVASCPVDEEVLDIYDVVVVTDRIIPVETILDAANAATLEPIYQEALTERIADALGCQVTTTGRHLDVQTTCTHAPKTTP